MAHDETRRLVFLVEKDGHRVLDDSTERTDLVEADEFDESEQNEHAERAQIEQVSIVDEAEREDHHDEHVKHFAYACQNGSFEFFGRNHQIKCLKKKF